MKISEELLPRWQKLLLVLFELSEGSKRQLKFEDIVVGAFKRFPETFHLRGYKQYPDSGDLIHKPLYDMRPSGLVTAHQKMFSLTDKGSTAARKLIKMTKKGGRINYKPSRDVGKEVERILSTEAFDLFRQGERDRILDTDFFQYIGASVHSTKNEFKNRLESVEYAVEEAKSYYPKDVHKLLLGCHSYLTDRFKEIIGQMGEKKERSYKR